MDQPDILTRITAIPGRVAGSDAERRAARLLARELRTGGRRPRVQTLWVRPSWAPVLALLCGLSVLGTVVGVDHPATGVAMSAAAAVLFALDISGRLPLLRRLTAARATQNVVSVDAREAPVRLIITAAIDTPRDSGTARGPVARLAAGGRARFGAAMPGGFGLAAFALTLAAVLAAVRALGVDDSWLGLVQLFPAAILIGCAGIALDRWTAEAGSGIGANASADATALALVAALDRSPPAMLAVDVVLAGAGEAHALGMRRFIAARRREGLRAEEVVVLHIAACAHGQPRWWTREGLVLPLRYHPRLTALAGQVAKAERHLGAAATESRGSTGARAARAVGWPAIAIGCLPADGMPVPADDAPADPAAMSACLQFSLAFVRALDRDLSAHPPAVRE